MSIIRFRFGRAQQEAQRVPGALTGETLRVEGRIRVRRLPQGWTEEDYAYWWLPPVDAVSKRALGPARMGEREKERYTVYETGNLLTVAGRAALLSYMGASSGNATGFAQYLAVGTGALMYPSPLDSALVTEVARKALSAFTVQGTQVDCNFQFASGDANAALSEAGLFGNGASGTSGSGTLMTHALFAYSKGNYSVSIDYLMNVY